MAFNKKGRFHLVIIVMGTFWTCFAGEWKKKCIQDCTQQVGSSAWPCVIHTHGKVGCQRVPVIQPVDQYNLPSQPAVNVTLYHDSYVQGIYSGIYPAINVTVRLDLTTGSSNIEGIQFILRGGTDHNDPYHAKYDYFNEELCTTYNLSAADTRWGKEVPRTVTFYYDCFKPLSPYSKYEVEVLMLPIAKNGERKGVIKHVKTPSCRRSPEFAVCGGGTTNDKEDDTDDDNSSRSPQETVWGPSRHDILAIYDTVYVSFDLPPPELKLNRLNVLLFKGSKYITNQIINVTEDGKSGITSNVSMVFYNVTPGEHMLKVQPIPIPSSICNDKQKCIVTTFPNFNVIANPCKPNPCGGHGNCSAVEASYNCSCHSYYYEANGTCISDPVSNNETWIVGVCVFCACVVAFFLIFLMWRCRKCSRLPTTTKSTLNSILVPENDSSPDIVPLVPKPPRILVVYSEDCPLYIRVVQATCCFLRRQTGCDVITDFWESNVIARKGLAPWLLDQFGNSDKILFLGSEGTKREWGWMKGRGTGKVQPDNFNSMLRVAMDTISADYNQGVHSERRGKYVCAYFPFSSQTDIPEALRNFGRPSIYEIPKEIKSMYVELMGLEENTASMERYVSEHLIESKLKETAEGTTLREAIESMTNYVTSHPRWFEEIRGTSSMFQETDYSPAETAETLKFAEQYREIENPIAQEFDV